MEIGLTERKAICASYYSDPPSSGSARLIPVSRNHLLRLPMPLLPSPSLTHFILLSRSTNPLALPSPRPPRTVSGRSYWLAWGQSSPCLLPFTAAGSYPIGHMASVFTVVASQSNKACRKSGLWKVGPKCTSGVNHPLAVRGLRTTNQPLELQCTDVPPFNVAPGP